MKHVIIGNSAAGIAAAQEIRKVDKECEIHIISKENEPVYSRCLLPNYISGEMNKEQLLIRDHDFYHKNKIKTLLGTKVVDILPSSNRIIMEDGSQISYDKLLIATGSKPFIPPIKNMDTVPTYTLNSLEDAARIIKDSTKAEKVVIAGGGFIGLELAFALRHIGKKVLVVEKAPRILSVQLDDFAAGLIQKELDKAGIELKLGLGVSEVIPNSKFSKFFGAKDLKGVILEDGSEVLCDMVVFAVGTRPNLDMVEKTEILKNRGIVVDQYMRTNIENIYAAGDAAETVDVVTKTQRLSPIWPNAVIQGRYAGCNMAGLNKSFIEQVGMQNTSEFREVPFISVGLVNPPDVENYEILTRYDKHKGTYRKIVLKDDVPVGMIFLGDITNAGVVAGFIRIGKNASDLKHYLLSERYSYARQLATE
jgi:NAD(P)H-nitrite reductase large subunit